MAGGMPVRFSAWLTESNSVLSGTTLEPNTITDGGPDELSSELSGSNRGNEVLFLKTYLEISEPPIFYSGELNADRNNNSNRSGGSNKKAAKVSKAQARNSCVCTRNTGTNSKAAKGSRRGRNLGDGGDVRRWGELGDGGDVRR